MEEAGNADVGRLAYAAAAHALARLGLPIDMRRLIRLTGEIYDALAVPRRNGSGRYGPPSPELARRIAGWLYDALDAPRPNSWCSGAAVSPELAEWIAAWHERCARRAQELQQDPELPPEARMTFIDERPEFLDPEFAAEMPVVRYEAPGRDPGLQTGLGVQLRLWHLGFRWSEAELRAWRDSSMVPASPRSGGRPNKREAVFAKLSQVVELVDIDALECLIRLDRKRLAESLGVTPKTLRRSLRDLAERVRVATADN